MMLTLDDMGDVKGKRIFVRADLNSPVENGKIVPGERIREAAKTIQELVKRGAKVVVLAHQGRKPKPGEEPDPDYLESLEQHGAVLEKFVKRKVTYVDDVVGETAKKSIGSMRDGWIVLLKNVRVLDDETAPAGGKEYAGKEEAAKAALVRELSPLCDMFVLDGFSVAHRAQASTVGFYEKPTYAGRVMQRELEALGKFGMPEDLVLVLGGAKPEDAMRVLARWLAEGKVKRVLVGGMLGTIMLAAKGKEIGESNRKAIEKKMKKMTWELMLEKAKALLADKEYKERIVIPKDVAVEVGGKRVDVSVRKLPEAGAEGPILDIGRKTANLYKNLILNEAKTILINGPVGVYENPEFAYGTKKVLRAIEKAGKPDEKGERKAFSLIGGGDTLAAVDALKIKKKNIGYISLAGKALVAYLNGEKLAGVELIEEWAKKRLSASTG